MSFRAATALGTSLVGLIPAAAIAQSAPAFNWTGFYLGATAGVAQSNATGTATYPDSGTIDQYYFSGNDLYFNGTLGDTGLPTMFTLDARGQTVGLKAGFNAASGSFVFGVEGDYNLLRNVSASDTETSTGGLTTVNVSSSLDSLMTLRARAGISADRLLLFATAGLAAGQSTLSSDFAFSETGKSAALSGSNTVRQVGYAVGGGAEYALTDNITIGGQALYFNLGDVSVTANDNGTSIGALSEPTTSAPYTATVSQSGVIVTTGINFKF